MHEPELGLTEHSFRRCLNNFKLGYFKQNRFNCIINCFCINRMHLVNVYRLNRMHRGAAMILCVR